ncbi:MAG: formylglycine-generating enzyme family protein, partial [Planctomycetota bacterium]|nr:formylglycine-generating enzyme family protein [Planctomycetota bacterium]
MKYLLPTKIVPNVMNPLCIPTFVLAVFALTMTTPNSSARAQDEVETVTNSIGMKLALIPAGTFTMGSPSGEAEREREETLHEITISKPFYMGVYEVTQSEFDLVVQGTDLRIKPTFPGKGKPMENVEWKNARFFCDRLSERTEEKAAGRHYRLPTEAEWEYA